MTRFGYVIVTYFTILAVVGSALVHPAPRLIWNATASTPTGLYALRPIGHLHVKDLVAVRPPRPLARFLADRSFLPKGVLLLKPVIALPGQTVCRSIDTIMVDHREIGTAKNHDHLGRPLPRWSGCRTLQPGEVFLMNPAVADSLDGRYFGPLPATAIVARAVPLWTDDADDGRFVRHAEPH